MPNAHLIPRSTEPGPPLESLGPRAAGPARLAILSVGFALVTAAAMVRVAGAAAAPDQWYAGLIAAAGTLWLAAFAIFVGVYAPIRWRPRLDGTPG